MSIQIVGHKILGDKPQSQGRISLSLKTGEGGRQKPRASSKNTSWQLAEVTLKERAQELVRVDGRVANHQNCVGRKDQSLSQKALKSDDFSWQKELGSSNKAILG